MAQVVLCPVCKGSGKITPENDGCPTTVPQDKTCHGCGGKGWVEVKGAAKEAIMVKPDWPWPVYLPNPIPFYPYPPNTRTYTY